MEQQIMHIGAELQREYGDRDWSMTFRAGPDSIGILYECILLTSRPEAMSIELASPGLKYTTLSANINHCAEIGEMTFRETARSMRVIAKLTDDLSRPDGIINKMLQYCEPMQTSARDRHLRRYIKDGEERVRECTYAIHLVKKAFDAWHSQTKALKHALQDTLGQKRRREQEVKNEIFKNEVERELKQNEHNEEEERMKERYESMHKLRKTKEWYDDSAVKMAASGGALLGGSLVATSAVVIAGVGAMAGAAVYIHYRSLQADILTFEERQAQKEIAIQELKASTANFKVVLAKLTAEEKSIDDITQIVESSITRIAELQQLIGNFMNFLLDLNVIIGYTVKRSNLIYETVSDIGGLEDPTIKQDLLEKALDMRTRFVFASRASDVYNAVSNQYILPALDKLPQLQLLGRTSKEVIGAKMDELHDMRSQACSGTEALATQMHRDLKATLTGLIRAPALTVEGIIEEDEDEDTAT